MIRKLFYLILGINRRSDESIEEPTITFDPMPKEEFKALSKELKKLKPISQREVSK